MIKEINVRVSPRTAAVSSELKQYVSEELGIDSGRIKSVQTVRSGIDARQRTIYINLVLQVYVDEPAPAQLFAPIDYPNVERGQQVVVVGAGPGGLFAALRLIECGLKPIVLERGKDVHARKKDIAQISRGNTVNPESNYAFGGGCPKTY